MYVEAILREVLSFSLQEAYLGNSVQPSPSHSEDGESDLFNVCIRSLFDGSSYGGIDRDAVE